MSWGFFLDLRCELPTKAAWTAVKKQRPEVLDAAWSGFEAKALRDAFRMPEVLAKTTFAKHLAGEDVTVTVDDTSVRVFAHRDRSELGLAGVLASLLDAVAAKGGSGELALVNDGTYSGEDGVLITRKAGGRRTKPKPLTDHEDRLVALTNELEGSLSDANDTRSDGTVFVGVRDPVTVGNAAFEVYKAGDMPGVRRVIEPYLDEGGERTAYLLRMYGVVLRSTIGADPPDVRERALDRLLGACESVPALRLAPEVLVDAVAVGNENGRAEQTIELVLTALREGLQPTPWLVINATSSGCRVKDVALQLRLCDALLPRLSDDSPLLSEPPARVSRAELLRWKGDIDGAFASLEAAFAADPRLREGVQSEKDEWGPRFVEDPRWKRIVG